MSIPLSDTLPEEGNSVVERIFNNVDFPAPLGPINPITLPDSSFIETSFNATLFLKFICKFFMISSKTTYSFPLNTFNWHKN
ncbi:hypothetical protein LDI01_11510 [Lentilactobacillus diolivorans]|uniref:Uncharacterized protein n=1 Tax=Lentilactobacillus diolivorans TaxID=179838 RepID=A0ABQ0XBT6_9LACO|nr:hypothetical protein LDI01_11510 [Lentilactobacillus diolivorans]